MEKAGRSSVLTTVGITNTITTTLDLFAFPNPFSIQVALKSRTFLNNATIRIYNSFGKKVKQINNIHGQSVIIRRDNLPEGVYVLELLENNTPIANYKLLIKD